MGRKRFKAEEIVNKLLEADVLIARGRPFGDQSIILGLAGLRLPRAKVVVLAVQRDDGAPGRLVGAVGRGFELLGIRHRADS